MSLTSDGKFRGRHGEQVMGDNDLTPWLCKSWVMGSLIVLKQAGPGIGYFKSQVSCYTSRKNCPYSIPNFPGNIPIFFRVFLIANVSPLAT